jgi:DNA-binding MarR family transcriptional regulator
MNYRGGEEMDGTAVPSGPIDTQQIEDFGRLLRHSWFSIVRGHTPHDGSETLGSQGYWVLAATAKAPRRMADLAGMSEVSSASLTGIVDRLEERGLVTRCRSTEDRRVVWVEITKDGRDRVCAAERHIHERVGALLTPLTDAERTELVRLLSKMNDEKGL